jgi:hypothetical protein
MRSPSLTIPLLACIAACAGRSRTAPAGESVAGTYELVACRAPCDPGVRGTTLARGLLVLEDQPYPLQSVPEPARSHFQDDPYLLIDDDKIADPNACFVMQRIPKADTYAGLTRVGMTTWRGENGGGTWLRLYQSPDAGYVLSLSRSGRDLRGTGKSWGGEDPRAEFPRDSVYARRVGPPDRAPCIRAATEEAEELRRDRAP